MSSVNNQINEIIFKAFPDFTDKNDFQFSLLRKWIILKIKRPGLLIDRATLERYEWHIHRVKMAMKVEPKLSINDPDLEIFEKVMGLIVFDSEINTDLGINLLHHILPLISKEIKTLNDLDIKIFLYYSLYYFSTTLKFCFNKKIGFEKAKTIIEILNFALSDSIRLTRQGLPFQLNSILNNLEGDRELLQMQAFLEWDPRLLKSKIFEAEQLQKIWRTLVFDYEFQLMIDASCHLKALEDGLDYLSKESLSVIYGVDF